MRKLREGERLLNDCKDLAEVLRHLEVSESSWNRWRAQYGGMKATEAKRLRELEVENGRLRKLLAEAYLDKAMLNWHRRLPASESVGQRREDYAAILGGAPVMAKTRRARTRAGQLDVGPDGVTVREAGLGRRFGWNSDQGALEGSREERRSARPDPRRGPRPARDRGRLRARHRRRRSCFCHPNGQRGRERPARTTAGHLSLALSVPLLLWAPDSARRPTTRLRGLSDTGAKPPSSYSGGAGHGRCRDLRWRARRPPASCAGRVGPTTVFCASCGARLLVLLESTRDGTVDEGLLGTAEEVFPPS